MKHNTAVGVAVAMLAMSATTAPAQDKLVKGRLTTVDLGSCVAIGQQDGGGAWMCNGLPGFPVYFVEEASRQMISYGPHPEQRLAARQTLGASNTIFRGTRRTTIEWRVERRGGRDVPYATIVRYHTARNGAKGQVLVVTKVGGSESCHLAYIDAVANPDAMALARSWADEEARRLDCSGEPKIIGQRGSSPM